MKVVSLFDGISCGRVALERAGLHVSHYVAFEIDQDAINVSNWNYPDIEHKGDIEGADFTPYIGYDLVIGGFPCTDLSIGKTNRQGLKGEKSRLFWEQVRAIKEIKPRYFLVENNYRMPKKDEAIITETLGVEPIHINSAKLSAQNRDRLYWTNIPNVTQPEDKGLILADVLEDKVALKYYHGSNLMGKQFNVNPSGRGQNGVVQGIDGKSYCLTTNKGEGQKLVYPVVDKVADLANGSQSGRVYDPNGKSVCLTSGGGGMGAKTGLYALGIAFRTRDTDQGRFKKPEIRKDDKANAITTVQTDSAAIMRVAEIGERNKHGKVMQGYGVYSPEGKSLCLTASTTTPKIAEKSYCLSASYGKKTVSDIPKKRHTPIYEAARPGVPLFLVEEGLLHYKERQIPVKLSDGFYAIRKLTPVECERLQTLPDGYTEMVSNTQRYRQLGNGWTVDVITHIFNHIHLADLL